jgi:hypothetical protein
MASVDAMYCHFRKAFAMRLRIAPRILCYFAPVSIHRGHRHDRGNCMPDNWDISDQHGNKVGEAREYGSLSSDERLAAGGILAALGIFVVLVGGIFMVAWWLISRVLPGAISFLARHPHVTIVIALSVTATVLANTGNPGLADVLGFGAYGLIGVFVLMWLYQRASPAR